jgi:aryl-alcohol dehydrogenase-like predicted oxidoreductase
MRQRALGRTGLQVSAICLGTMTWGRRNTEAEGHAQADLAVDLGVTFMDTAEMYPVAPVTVATVGRTEEIIGTWLARRKTRAKIVLATKVTGGDEVAVRDGAPLDGKTLRAAVEGSLVRLQTDYIDLFQLHWPNRPAYHFRDIWRFDPSGQDRAGIEAHMLDILEVSAELIKEGKIRHIALSNESVWGAAKWLNLAERHNLPRMASVQNEYSLLCRQFDSDWAEFSALEELPLLAFSPLATGLLSGKYGGDVIPNATRRVQNPTLSGRVTPRVFPAVAAYLGVAARHCLDPAQMAIAWTMQRPFACIPIIGATNLVQLKDNIAAAQVTLDASILQEIDLAHFSHPQPY